MWSADSSADRRDDCMYSPSPFRVETAGFHLQTDANAQLVQKRDENLSQIIEQRG